MSNPDPQQYDCCVGSLLCPTFPQQVQPQKAQVQVDKVQEQVETEQEPLQVEPQQVEPCELVPQEQPEKQHQVHHDDSEVQPLAQVEGACACTEPSQKSQRQTFAKALVTF